MARAYIGESTDKAASKGKPLPFFEAVRIQFSGLRFRRTALWREVHSFSQWVELEASGIASDVNQRSFRIEITSDGKVDSLFIGQIMYNHDLDEFQLLWKFLASLGIKTVDLDARLEQNQVRDVLRFLYACRNRTDHNAPGRVSGNRPADMNSNGIIRFSCTRTSIESGTLTIRYTYCVLLFSSFVEKFKGAHKTFRDHRALFNSAPRFAFIFGPLILLPRLVLAFSYGNWTLFLIACFEGLLFMGFIYVFFMTVGSIEYDKEEQAYELALAYGTLKDHTGQIEENIKQAQLVQEHFLPDIKCMPLPDRTRWAASFKPADDLGGDYFDAQHINDDCAAIIFADVSGHGMSAALCTAIIKTTFQAWLDNPIDLLDLANQLNSALVRLTASNQFAAIFLACYDASSRELTYLNCGHYPEPYRIAANGSSATLSSLNAARALVIGFQPRIVGETSTIVLDPGDMILLSSDGVVENQNEIEEQYGEERFEQLLKKNRHSSPVELVATIENEIEQFSNGSAQADDMTILALQVF